MLIRTIILASTAAFLIAPDSAAAQEQDKLTLKPFGRIQYDLGHVSRPDGIDDPGLGFSSELRRARLGVQGDVPGGFGYKIELDFADNDIEITDAFLSYDASDAVAVTLGQHNNFQSLEELTSSRFTSFTERAAFTDAFNFERRVGLSATLEAGDVLLQGGLFTDNIDVLASDEAEGVGVDSRLVWAPKIDDLQLHLGASTHWRDKGDLEVVGTTRYRQRPLIHSTDVRFISTPAIPVENERHYGFEAAMLRGPLHLAGEVHWLDAESDGFDANFFGGYAEVGWFLTGETRGYKGGKFDRTKVLRPVGQGGAGAFQVNLRYDYIDLSDGPVIGGRQNGYQASLIWIPTDHVRFLLNYARLNYDDAALPGAGGRRNYHVDVIGARAQVDF